MREEQRMMDRKIVAEIDQKVIDQQNTLEKAGVPGFFITTNPQVSQLYLLQLAFHLTCNFDAKKCPADGNVYPVFLFFHIDVLF